MKNVITYLLAGAGVGAAAGLLWAPNSGKRLRARMKCQATKGFKRVKNSGMDLRDQAREMADSGAASLMRQALGMTAAFEVGRRAYRKIAG